MMPETPEEPLVTIVAYACGPEPAATTGNTRLVALLTYTTVSPSGPSIGSRDSPLPKCAAPVFAAAVVTVAHWLKGSVVALLCSAVASTICPAEAPDSPVSVVSVVSNATSTHCWPLGHWVTWGPLTN